MLRIDGTTPYNIVTITYVCFAYLGLKVQLNIGKMIPICGVFNGLEYFPLRSNDYQII